MSKFTLKRDRQSVTSSGGVLGALKRGRNECLAAKLKASVIVSVPTYDADKTVLIAPRAAVPDVLRGGCGPKVRAPVIESVMIDMINLDPFWTIEDHAMHVDGCSGITAGNKYAAHRAGEYLGLKLANHRVPLKRQDQSRVLIIDERDKAFRQGNLDCHDGPPQKSGRDGEVSRPRVWEETSKSRCMTLNGESDGPRSLGTNSMGDLAESVLTARTA